MDTPLSRSDILCAALEINHISEAECIKYIARKMRTARKAIVCGRQIEYVVDANARADAAETLLDYLGHHRATRVEGRLHITCAKELTDEQLAIIATGSGSGVTGQTASQD